MSKALKWDDIAADTPIPLLTRRMVTGEQMLVARVELAAGCKVALHQHVSEQFACLISGRVRWGVGQPGTPERSEFEMGPGEVLPLPSNVPHEVEALEDSLILDILAPPGKMGVDSQRDE